MRIQETDRILKEAKLARRGAEVERGGFAWRSWLTGTVVALVAVAGLFAYLRRNS